MPIFLSKKTTTSLSLSVGLFIAVSCVPRQYNQENETNSVAAPNPDTKYLTGEELLDTDKLDNTWSTLVMDDTRGNNAEAEIDSFREPITKNWDCAVLKSLSVCRMHHELNKKAMLWIRYTGEKILTLLPKISITLNGVKKEYPTSVKGNSLNIYVTNGVIRCNNKMANETLETRCSESSPEYKRLFKSAFVNDNDSGAFSPWTVTLSFYEKIPTPENDTTFTFNLGSPQE